MTDMEKIDSLFSAAISLQKAGEKKKAIELLDEIISGNPDFVDAHVLKGAILQEEEDYDGAESAFRKALDIQPDHSEALQALGLFLVTQERYEEALPYLRRHLEKTPDDSSSLDGILKAFLELPDHRSDALDVLKRAWNYSTNPEIGLRYARYLTFLGKEKEEVYEVFNEILKVAKTPKILSDFAFSCWFFDDYEMAIDLLKQAINIDPSFADAIRLLAQCYYLTDDLSKALETIEKAISLEPNDYRSWQLKTDIFIKKKEYEKALTSAEKGIEIIKKDSEVLESLNDSLITPFFQKVFIFFKLNKVEEALGASLDARNLIPKNKHFYLYPAQKLTELGRPNKALEILDSVNDPYLKENFEPYRYMLLHKMNRTDDARAFIEPIINKDPEKVNKLADIAVRRYLDGERNLAISITSQLVNLCPDVIRLKTNLGYMQIGERAYDQAESLLIDVIDTKIIDEDEEIFIVMSKCNLLYLYILQNKFDKTFSLLEEIFASNKRDEEAILRVPFWFQGEIQPDPAQFPGRDITMEMAALGCGIAAALAQGDIEKADKLNDSLIDKEFEDPLPLICEGCVQASKGNQEEAVDAFTEAIKMSENEEEKSILQNWLEKLENNDSNNNS